MTARLKYLRRREASEYLKENWGVSLGPNTLAKLAVQGGGPPFQKDGPFPIYTTSNLDAFAEARLSPVVTSTSELKRRQPVTAT